MQISNFKVRTRLVAGFAVLIAMSIVISVFALRELGHLDETVNQLTTEDWETIQGATTLHETTQQNAALVEEAAAASQAIVEQAQTLNAVVARFNVGEIAMRATAKAEARAERRPSERAWASRQAKPRQASTPAPALKAAGGGADWSEF